MVRWTDRKCHTPQRKRVNLSACWQQPKPADRERSLDVLAQIGHAFQQTVDSGDPFESLARSTKRLWRGLID